MKKLAKSTGICVLLFASSINSIVLANNAASARRQKVQSSNGTALIDKARASRRSAAKTKQIVNTLQHRSLIRHHSNGSNKAHVKHSPSKTGPVCTVLDDEGCFTDCLRSWNIPPETIQECANQCAGGQWGTCATCLGVGLFIVMYCAYECAPLQSENRTPKRIQTAPRNRPLVVARNKSLRAAHL